MCYLFLKIYHNHYFQVAGQSRRVDLYIRIFVKRDVIFRFINAVCNRMSEVLVNLTFKAVLYDIIDELLTSIALGQLLCEVFHFDIHCVPKSGPPD